MTQTALTREQVLAKPPGEELDEMISKYVFEVDMVAHVPYSTDISVAMEVEKAVGLEKYRWRYVDHITWFFLSTQGVCEVYDMMQASPEIRCKAALLAVLDL